MTQPFILTLSGDIGLRGIETLKAEIVAALASHDAVSIDATAVESADASAVQLLLSAQRTANADGKTFSLEATAAGPLATCMVALGLLAGDGHSLVPDTSTWTLTEAAA